MVGKRLIVKATIHHCVSGMLSVGACISVSSPLMLS